MIDYRVDKHSHTKLAMFKSQVFASHQPIFRWIGNFEPFRCHLGIKKKLVQWQAPLLDVHGYSPWPNKACCSGVSTQICWPGGSGSACIGGVLRGNNGTTHRCHILESRVFFAMITICLRYGGPDRLKVEGNSGCCNHYFSPWRLHNVHISSSPGNRNWNQPGLSYCVTVHGAKILRTQIAGLIGQPWLAHPNITRKHTRFTQGKEPLPSSTPGRPSPWTGRLASPSSTACSRSSTNWMNRPQGWVERQTNKD